MDSLSAQSFPSIHSSFRFHPHDQLFTYNIPRPTEASPAEMTDPRTPLSATTIIDYPESANTQGPLAWLTTLHPLHPPPYLTHPHRPAPSTLDASSTVTSTSTPMTVTEAAQPAISTTASGGIEKGAKIGIALGISVTILLSLIALTIGLLDCRRRFRKRREKRQLRYSELSMWETELKDGRSDKNDGRTGGLWSGLLPGRQRTGHPMPTRGDGIWESVGAVRSARAESSVRGQSVIGPWGSQVPTQVPTDRASVVSSVGSLGLPIMQAPTAPRSFLNLEERR